MRSLLLLLCFLLVANCLLSQDSLRQNKKYNFGLEASVTSGFYSYSLGASYLHKKRHALGLGISVWLPERLYEENWNLGAYLDYNYFFWKMNKRIITPYINVAFQYLNITNEYNYGSVNYQEKLNNVFNLLGLGANFKILKNLFLKSSLSIYTCGYSHYSFERRNSGSVIITKDRNSYFSYNYFQYFLEDYLVFRGTLSYYF